MLFRSGIKGVRLLWPVILTMQRETIKIAGSKMKIRPPQPQDQENAEKAFRLIHTLVLNHPEIDPNTWVSACSSLIARSFMDSGTTYDEYLSEMKSASKHYKKWWDEE